MVADIRVPKPKAPRMATSRPLAMANQIAPRPSTATVIRDTVICRSMDIRMPNALGRSREMIPLDSERKRLEVDMAAARTAA